MADLPYLKSSTALGEAPISHIKSSLDRLLGKGKWESLSLVTISLELKVELDDLLQDKISVLKALAEDPDLFFYDPVFMAYATEVINNNVADFNYFPMPLSLELAFSISEVQKIMKSENAPFVVSAPLVQSVAWILRHEGYSEPVAPFDFVPEEMLTKGQTKEDTANKEKAIQEYIKNMGRA